MRNRILLALVLLIGCKDDQGTAGGPKPKVKVNTENVVQFKPAVPLGKKVPCEQMLDVAKISPIIAPAIPLSEEDRAKHTKDGTQPEIVVQSMKENFDDKANAVCRIKMGGTPLAPDELEKRAGKEKEYSILGIVPGDEICMITAYCSFPYELGDAAKVKCEKDGYPIIAGDEKIGDYMCTQMVQAGSKDRFVHLVWAPATKCMFKVQPGPGGSTREISDACAQAAVDTITPENLKVP